MNPTQQPIEFSLDMNAEVAAQKQNPKQPVESGKTADLAAQIAGMQQAQSLNDLNPLAAEKAMRDLNYQRQMQELPQPDSAPLLQPTTTPELDRLEQLQKELDATKAEAAQWKTKWGHKTGEIGLMKRELADMNARLSQMQPAINVQQITGRQPDEPLTAQDAVNLLMSQSQAFGNVISQIREEMRNAQSPANDGLPLDMEAELVEAHPWLSNMDRPNKLRAMHDILASAGVTVAPPAANSPAAMPPTSTLPAAARAPVRGVTYTEPSNRGSAAERGSIAPERQALNDKLAKLKELQSKPGGSAEMEKILASLGAGAVDETQMGFYTRR